MPRGTLVVCWDLQLPLLPQQLLDAAGDRVPEVLQHVVTLRLLLVWTVCLMTVVVMDVVAVRLVVLVAAVLGSRRLKVGCS